MLHHAQFTSNSHALIIVHNYDIYYRLGPRTYQVFRVTNDARPGVVFNGIPDWLYEGKFHLFHGCFWFKITLSVRCWWWHLYFLLVFLKCA